jgi:pyridoxine/pyridoxamine 5'-phosphate oxidase
MSGGEEHETVARKVIDSNQFMTIATADGEGVPWVSPVLFASEEHREFFWVSDPEARHSTNIAARPRVAIVIFDSHEAGGWRAVYFSATAGEVAGADLMRGWRSTTGGPLTGACANGRRTRSERRPSIASSARRHPSTSCCLPRTSGYPSASRSPARIERLHVRASG